MPQCSINFLYILHIPDLTLSATENKKPWTKLKMVIECVDRSEAEIGAGGLFGTWPHI